MNQIVRSNNPETPESPPSASDADNDRNPAVAQNNRGRLPLRSALLPQGDLGARPSPHEYFE